MEIDDSLVNFINRNKSRMSSRLFNILNRAVNNGVTSVHYIRYKIWDYQNCGIITFIELDDMVWDDYKRQEMETAVVGDRVEANSEAKGGFFRRSKWVYLQGTILKFSKNKKQAIVQWDGGNQKRQSIGIGWLQKVDQPIFNELKK